MVLLLAGMKGIPQELYEAAAIDGAKSTQSFFHITFPMLTPVIFFNLVTGMIGALQTFAQVFIVTAGGPDNASQMVVPYLFQNAFQFYKMGYASAIAWVLFIIIMALTLVVFRSSALWVHYEEEKRMSNPSTAEKTISYIFLILVGVLLASPFLYMISIALASDATTVKSAFTFVPLEFQWSNFYTILPTTT